MGEKATHKDPTIIQPVHFDLLLPSADKERVFNNTLIMTGLAHPQLARDTRDELSELLMPGQNKKLPLCEPVTIFDEGGERRVVIDENVRGKDVVLIQPICLNRETQTNVNDAWAEILLMLDALIRASVGSIRVVIPYYGYGRQDRKSFSREPISAATVAQHIDFGASPRLAGITTIDLHSPQTQGSIRGPWDDLYARHVLLPFIDKKIRKPRAVVAPDVGASKADEKIAKKLEANLAIAHKMRDPLHPNDSTTDGIMGIVAGQHTLIVDDLVAGGGTLVNTARSVIKERALSVNAMITHAQLYGDALQKIMDSPIETLYTTDTLPHRREVRENSKIKIITVAPMLAKAILCSLTGESISEHLLR